MRIRFSLKWTGLRTALSAAYAKVSRFFDGNHSVSNQALDQIIRARRWPLLAFTLCFSASIAALLVTKDPRSTALPVVRAGEIAESSVVSPLTIELEPKETTSKNRDEIYRKIAPIFDYDDTTLAIWVQNWSQAFTAIRAKYFTSGAPRISQIQLLDRLGEIVRKETGQTLIASDLLYLAKNHFSKELEGLFQEMTKPLLGRLISEVDLFPSYYSTGVIVRQLNLGLNETLINDVSRIWSLDHARALIAGLANTGPRKKNVHVRKVSDIVQQLIVPNLKFNPELTERRVTNALGRRDAPLILVRKGQTLLRMGERATERQAELVDAIRAATSFRATWIRFLLLTGILSLFFYTLVYLDLSRKSFLRLQFKNGLVFAGITSISIALMKFSLPYLSLLTSLFGAKGGGEYLIPVAAGGILIQLLLGRELAFTFVLLGSVAGGLMVERSLYYSIWILSVSMMAIQTLGACKQRTDLYKSGAWSGAIAALMVLAFDLIQSLGLQSTDWFSMAVHAIGAFLSSVFASLIAGTIIPVFEHLLGYTTNLKLLELSNFNHPLLHNLMMKAPGTYHHSVMVGSLAEIAADRIKANPLLARVSAYYHDIGKMANPLYFIENQSPQYNPHDHLSPAVSARILFSHVKNGARMGKEHGLGDSINDVIQQHHGTTMATFFYNKAKEQAPAEAADDVHETDYRYPGPRPQSREAAIVMIADACEASTRSIPDPTPAKIQTMVNNIITKRFLDQQFHDCDLTLKDLKIIEESISRTLLSLYHQRIEYPGQKQALGEPTVEMSRKIVQE